MKRIGLCTLIFACFLCSCNKDESVENATQKDTGKLQTQALEREGLDGAGKSTQVRMLKDYLASRPGGLEYIHFPRYDAPVYGELISRFLRGDFGDNDSVHPQLRRAALHPERGAVRPL